MRESIKEGTLFDLLFVNRGLVSWGLSLAQDHRMIQFSVVGEKWNQQDCYLGFSVDRLWPVSETGEWTPLGGSSEGPRSPRR